MNLALNKPAVLSSTCKWSRFDDKVQEAAIGNDGSKASDTYFHTGWELFPWWQVDLGETCRIDRIAIFNRVGLTERLKSFRVMVSLDGRTWSECHRAMLCDPFDDVDIALDDRPLARFVKVQNLGLGFLHLREVEIFGEPEPVENAPPLMAMSAHQPIARANMSTWAAWKCSTMPSIPTAFALRLPRAGTKRAKDRLPPNSCGLMTGFWKSARQQAQST